MSKISWSEDFKVNENLLMQGAVSELQTLHRIWPHCDKFCTNCTFPHMHCTWSELPCSKKRKNCDCCGLCFLSSYLKFERHLFFYVSLIIWMSEKLMNKIILPIFHHFQGFWIWGNHVINKAETQEYFIIRNYVITKYKQKSIDYW